MMGEHGQTTPDGPAAGGGIAQKAGGGGAALPGGGRNAPPPSRPPLSRGPFARSLPAPRLDPAGPAVLRRDPCERAIGRLDLDLRVAPEERHGRPLRRRLGPERDSGERDERGGALRPRRRPLRRLLGAPSGEERRQGGHRPGGGTHPPQPSPPPTGGIAMPRRPRRGRAGPVVESWMATFFVPFGSISRRPRRRSSSRTIS